jgi:hypothetical protein
MAGSFPKMSDPLDPYAAHERQTQVRRFFFCVPNIVFKLGLTPHEFTLYSAIRRTAGEKGYCFRSGRNLALLCRLSTGQVSRCKRRLAAPFEKLGGKPLIRIVKLPSSHGGKAYHDISVVDIWVDNDECFSPRQSPPPSVRELGTSTNEIATSPVEPKKTLRRKVIEEGGPSVSPSSRETETTPLSEFWNFLCTIFGRTNHRGPTRNELRSMRHWLPVSDEEYRLIEWWMDLENDYDTSAGIGFHLLRRPRSVRSLLRHWGDVCDVARSYWKKYDRDGHFY